MLPCVEYIDIYIYMYIYANKHTCIHTCIHTYSIYSNMYMHAYVKIFAIYLGSRLGSSQFGDFDLSFLVLFALPCLAENRGLLKRPDSRRLGAWHLQKSGLPDWESRLCGAFALRRPCSVSPWLSPFRTQSWGAQHLLKLVITISNIPHGPTYPGTSDPKLLG